ncbi:MAG: flagellar motor protein MotB [Bdellovibrionales bacterium]|nr:flagellar motor protein MotB [Bdellovibrionales bacterium]
MMLQLEQNHAPVFRQAWLLTFGDLLTLMLCFFIALCSFQRFGSEADGLTDGNNSEKVPPTHKQAEELSAGTPLAKTNIGGALPGLVLNEEDFSDRQGSLSQFKAQELGEFVAQALSHGRELEIESCAEGAQEQVLTLWAQSMYRAQDLQQLLTRHGVPPQAIRVRVLGPHCELLGMKEKSARAIVRGI